MNQITDLPKTLIDELGLNTLANNKQEELLAKMAEVVLKRIFLETINKLNEEDVNKYKEMIDLRTNPEEIEKFLKDKIPNYYKFVKKIAEDFKEEIKKSADLIK